MRTLWEGAKEPTAGLMRRSLPLGTPISKDRAVWLLFRRMTEAELVARRGVAGS